MGVLQDDQFAAAVNQGGASRLLHSSEAVLTGEKGRGYAVARPGDTELKAPVPLTAGTAREHADMLRAQPHLANDNRAMQGGWRGTDSGDGREKAYLDLSHLRDDRKAAVSEGRAGRQEAIYDMKHERDIYMAKPTPQPPARVRGSRRTGYVVKGTTE